MQLFILGPLPGVHTSGGVAVFTANLAQACAQLGHKVTVYTATRPLPRLGGVQVQPLKMVRTAIRQQRPALVVSSLWYSLWVLRSTPGVQRVHLLHGFTNLSAYSWWRVQAMILCDRLIRHCLPVVLANSPYTRQINETIYHLPVDGTFQIGVAPASLAALKHESLVKQPVVLYLGRLVAAKNVALITACFKQLDVSNAQLQLVGYGPLAAQLRHQAQTDHRIHLVGSVAPARTSHYYLRAHVFISLNPAEPFGITYLEALIANDFIIAPTTGGAVDLLRQFPERVALVDVHQPQQIVQALRRGLTTTVPDFKQTHDLGAFSYQRTAREIIQKGAV